MQSLGAPCITVFSAVSLGIRDAIFLIISLCALGPEFFSHTRPGCWIDGSVFRSASGISARKNFAGPATSASACSRVLAIEATVYYDGMIVCRDALPTCLAE